MLSRFRRETVREAAREPDADTEAAPQTPPSAEDDNAPDAGVEADAGAQLAPGDLAKLAGAATVPDLLTVSAAWLTLVDRKATFGRRDVMEVFDQIPGEHQRTLEARIKGYGKLVRNGVLMLVDDGRFALSQEERSRFRDLIG